ncbi:hypothetical protein GCM10027059_05820 [Myceligenerans halotolerans]
MGDSSGITPGSRAGSDRSRPTRDTRLLRVRSDGTPVYGYDQRPGVPPIGVVHLRTGTHQAVGHEAALPGRRHVHDFHVLVYVHRGHGSVRIDGAERVLRAGDVFGVAPGRTIEPGDALPSEGGLAWAVQFLPDVVPALASVSPLVWDLHPLLRVFSPSGARSGAEPAAPDTPARPAVPAVPDTPARPARPARPATRQGRDNAAAAGPERHDGSLTRETASVPGPERERWRAWFEDLADEAAHPERTAAPEAMVAGLTRILVAAARLAPGPPSAAPDPLLVRVFDQVETMFRDPVSAGDVAHELGYTPGHLTTVVRERSGRTVGEWLTERRLTEARRLLLETDLPLGAVAARTGLRDGAYLGRRFRHRYGTSPDRWRRERRADAGPAR